MKNLICIFTILNLSIGLSYSQGKISKDTIGNKLAERIAPGQVVVLDKDLSFTVATSASKKTQELLGVGPQSNDVLVDVQFYPVGGAPPVHLEPSTNPLTSGIVLIARKERIAPSSLATYYPNGDGLSPQLIYVSDLYTLPKTGRGLVVWILDPFGTHAKGTLGIRFQLTPQQLSEPNKSLVLELALSGAARTFEVEIPR